MSGRRLQPRPEIVELLRAGLGKQANRLAELAYKATDLHDAARRRDDSGPASLWAAEAERCRRSLAELERGELAQVFGIRAPISVGFSTLLRDRGVTP